MNISSHFVKNLRLCKSATEKIFIDFYSKKTKAAIKQ